MTKNEIIKLCENELNYYDIVDECSETVEFGMIIDFLIEKGVVEIRRYKDPEVISENSPIQEIYYVNSAVISFPMGCSELIPYTRDDFDKTVFLTPEKAKKR